MRFCAWTLARKPLNDSAQCCGPSLKLGQIVHALWYLQDCDKRRGLIPAATGNFVSHGVRTFSYEAAFTTLTGLTKGAAELQVLSQISDFLQEVNS